MGDIDKTIFKQTGMLKSLTGEDLLRMEMKGKPVKNFRNYAKIVCAANKLPETTDKSIGFYRRWCILDFPNIFNESQDVLKSIPDEEYRSFCGQSIELIKTLIQRGGFEKKAIIRKEKRRMKNIQAV